MLDSKHFEEVKENDLIANSGQTLSDNHLETANDVLNDNEDEQTFKSSENQFAGLMDPITLFRYMDCKTPDVIVRQSDNQVFLMFEAKGIETPIVPNFTNFY